MSCPIEIGIVGAGYSGTLVAAQLLTRARSPLTVHLIERNPSQFGRGVAYGTDMDCHLLNVPAANMSAFPDDPEHFLRWAKDRERSLVNPPWVTEVTSASFLPRRAYGDYLSWILDHAEQNAAPGVRLERRFDEAIGLTIEPQDIGLRLASGAALRVQRVVLSIGNFPPGNPRVADTAFYRSRRYHANPWVPGVLAALLPTESCLLIGSGLTMVDWAIALTQAGYRGTIHVLSRRGLWPNGHRLGPPAAFAINPNTRQPAVRTWLRLTRQYIDSKGCGWRSVIDALRPTCQVLWKSLPLAEQRRFLRHLRPYWDMHRHRLAPAVAERLNTLLASRQLIRHIGRIETYHESAQGVEIQFRRRHSERVESLRVDAVVNCSGPESDYRKLENPLIRNLLDQHLVRPDPLALGLETGPDGALIGADGTPSERLFTLGPPQKGMLWETTAVPEIRGQAARLAVRLLDDDVGNQAFFDFQVQANAQ